MRPSVRKIVEIKNNPGDPALRELLERLGRGEERIAVGGLEGAARSSGICTGPLS
jgi:hypothetical protein